ncbi:MULTISPECIES: Rha family transcriptional regulator [Pseudomonas]|uniref:Rha family transcriptional regulator n=1 Tax=Pseudomonas promysalinigenes TaxID=485898 RepID=A0ABY6AQ83_9PSED|nr:MULTISPECIES: Rha family transcriptional regulator [Pseudomonas]UXH41227.1 Rha family transcriptional regulator [Pseudomonas promysalinigenes]
MNLILTTALTMSSRDIADLVGSRHDKVKQSIERLAARTDGNGKRVIDLPPVGEYLDSLGRPANEYLVNKRDSFVVVAQLSPEFTAALVDRWQKLEEQAAAPALPTDYITALEHLLASKRSEQLALEQRDEAVRTKAEIGTRREATAMATASAAVRKVMHLENELGRGCQHATVTAVEKAARRSFGTQGFRPLKTWCDSHGVAAPKVQDPRFGWVRSWPAAAWAAVYQIDLAELFGTPGETA